MSHLSAIASTSMCSFPIAGKFALSSGSPGFVTGVSELQFAPGTGVPVPEVIWF
jgi:hypothetical protein